MSRKEDNAEDRTPTAKSVGAFRNKRGQFAAGNPGKPKGTRNKATRQADKIMQGQTEAITAKAIELALLGDTTALKLCLDRIAPPPKDRPVRLEMPEIHAASDMPVAITHVLNAVAVGEVTPHEARTVSAVIADAGRAFEIAELEERLASIESALNANQRRQQ